MKCSTPCKDQVVAYTTDYSVGAISAGKGIAFIISLDGIGPLVPSTGHL